MVRTAATLFALFAAAHAVLAQDVKPPNIPPLKVLWCTGGGFHDYKGLLPILTKGIQKHLPLPVVFTASTNPKAWAKRGFADRYDAIVLFFSIHDPAGRPVVENLARTIHDGKPAVVIHGTLHSYRELGAGRSAFCEAMGLTSVRHDRAKEITVKKVSDHWIVADWPADWKTPFDELYENVKLWPNATPLLTAYSDVSKKDQVVAWINRYGKGRVFGATLGHDHHTADMDSYHRLLASGLLWACAREKK